MGITNDEILSTIEARDLAYPEIPGKLEYFDIEGIQGWYSPSFSHPLLNLVTKTTLTTENADATIQKVLDQFKAQQKAFGWWANASSTPPDLGMRLQTAGLTKINETVGMSIDVQHPIPVNPEIHVRQAKKSDASLIIDMYHRAFPVPIPLAEHRVELWELMGVINYFAYVEDHDDPVAVASMWYRPDHPIVLLGGAATLPEYRGRGVYTSLVAQRLKIAHDNGMQTAVISAVRSTSAPICQKVGFVERCGLDLYAWMSSES